MKTIRPKRECIPVSEIKFGMRVQINKFSGVVELMVPRHFRDKNMHEHFWITFEGGKTMCAMGRTRAYIIKD